MVDDHRQEREVELAVGGRDRPGRSVPVDDPRMRAAALGIGAHLRRGLDRHDASAERIGEQHRKPPGAGAQIQNRQVRTVATGVAGDRVHPEPAGVGGEAPAGAIRLIEAPLVVDSRHQRASGSGSLSNASTGIGTGGAISSRSASA